MERHLCIHGHFYQPPRENPGLEAIELQDSAYPYHDWNERITDECYAPNARSRMLDSEGHIARIANNYSRISFNFGPTLLSWLEVHATDTYTAILEADRHAQERFSGHGSAIAQGYNHMIHPLANDRDRHTQVAWGIRDFEHRFGRRPEGMWLPETAMDLASLDALAEQGIRFTIAAPRQAKQVRPPGGEWLDVSDSRIDPTRPYVQHLPSGRSIVIFFYDGPISQAVAFERLLNNGETFALRLMGGFNDRKDGAQLMHIATDGETYGHHHRHGEMALAFALEHIELQEGVRLTNYGEFLESHPAEWEVEIFEQSSWSCVHGVERWRSDCGCYSGMWPDSHQRWRGPLRDSLDWLRDSVAPLFEKRGAEVFRDPWAAREDYVDIVLDRSPETVASFLAKHARQELSESDQILAWNLLELQRHAMLMYTSCGWFFDEISGIENVQVLRYASRVVQIVQQVFGVDLEPGFLEQLEKAPSNDPRYGNGKEVYRRCVQPSRVDLGKVGAHYAVSTLFGMIDREDEETSVYCYTVRSLDRQERESGQARLLVGRATITSNVTGESEDQSYGFLHLGDHNLTGGVRRFEGESKYQKMVSETVQAFERVDFAQTIRLFDQHFGTAYSLKSLFTDAQREILDRVVESALGDAEHAFSGLYERYAPLMRFITDTGAPLPSAFRMTADFVLNTTLKATIQQSDLDAERLRRLLDEVSMQDVQLDVKGLGFAYEKLLVRMIRPLAKDQIDLSALRSLDVALDLVRSLPFEVDLRPIQNTYYEYCTRHGDVSKRFADIDDDASRGALIAHLRSIGQRLAVRVK
ncbi:MAG: DUF3536 domain-containing protein [Planctomycetota bacterium]